MLSRYLVIFILLSSCQSKVTKVSKVINGQLIVAEYKMGKLHGTVMYYDLNGNLRSTCHYVDGIKEGLAINYYYSGKVKDSVTYRDNEKMGEYSLYDERGNLTYKSYYIAGTSVGPQFNFSNGIIKEYGFKNFEKSSIFYCEYDSLGEVKMFGGDFPNAFSYGSTLNNIKYKGIFIYLPNPPGLGLSFGVGIYNTNTKSTKELFKVNSKKIFFDTLLPLTDSGDYYYVSGRFLDSVKNVVNEKLKVLND